MLLPKICRKSPDLPNHTLSNESEQVNDSSFSKTDVIHKFNFSSLQNRCSHKSYFYADSWLIFMDVIEIILKSS